VYAYVLTLVSFLCAHRYDLLFGVVRAEAYFVFAAEDIQYGIESERRGKLLKAFVRDTYRWALNNIMCIIKHALAEYFAVFATFSLLQPSTGNKLYLLTQEAQSHQRYFFFSRP
jgi:hypothetical protein